MKNYDFSLILWKLAERLTQVALSGVVPLRGTEP